MRVLLVTTSDELAEKLNVLNPELEYCGIITNEIEPAKEILTQVSLSEVPLYPMSELKTCVENLDYDYVLVVQDKFYGTSILWALQKYNFPKDKVIGFAELSGVGNWQTERHLRYYREHAQEFEMFATGTSYSETAIDIRKFKRKAINFATSSQDLYYNFQIAKSAILYGGGQGKFRYALIGLAPYSFHFDLTKTFLWKSRVLPYFIAFNDIHNLPAPIDVYKKFLREEWLTRKPSIQKVNINGVKSLKVMTQEDIDSNLGIFSWRGKYYPETRDENIKILDDYLTLCEENNIRPVMFMAPFTEKSSKDFNSRLLEEFYNLVEQALQKHSGAVFVNCLKWDEVTYADFYNHEHMNVHGATKFSAYLNDFIEQLER